MSNPDQEIPKLVENGEEYANSGCGKNKRWKVERDSRVVVASRLNGGNGLLGSKVPKGEKKNDGKGFGGAAWPRRGVVPGGSTGATAGGARIGTQKKRRHWKKSKKV